MAEVIHLGTARTTLFDFSTHLGASAGSVPRAVANASLAASQRVTITTSKAKGLVAPHLLYRPPQCPSHVGASPSPFSLSCPTTRCPPPTPISCCRCVQRRHRRGCEAVPVRESRPAAGSGTGDHQAGAAMMIAIQ